MNTDSQSIDNPVALTRSDKYTLFRDFVTARITALQGGYLRRESGAGGSLAILRRALGGEPGSDPLVWQYTLGLPNVLAGKGDDPSPAECAMHYAVTLFALHQQSQSVGMHQRGPSLGSAARRLGEVTHSEDAVRRRFTALGTASSLAEASIHARGLIGQFRASKISIDYGLLAVDFFKLQNPRLANGVRLVWGRDYYRVARVENNSKDQSTEQTTEIHEEGELL